MMWEPPVGQGYPRPVRVLKVQQNRILVHLEQPAPVKKGRRGANVRWVYAETLKAIPV